MNRVVLLCGRWAIKLPSMRHGHRYFVGGMLSNALEAERWTVSKHPTLAPVLASLPFGLLLVARRYDNVLTRLLTIEEMSSLPFINFDNNGHNAALHNEQVVLIDYGNSDMYLAVA